MRLHELVKYSEPVKLTRNGGKYFWDGYFLSSNGENMEACFGVILAEDWQLDAPTLESVCKERGWKFNEVSACVLIDDTTKHLHCHANFPPAKLAKMLDVLEGKE